MESNEYLAVVDRVCREVLDRGVMFTRCDCTIHDSGPYSGDASSNLDVLSLKKSAQWQALIWYRFQTSVDKFGGDEKFSLTTDSRFMLFVFDSGINSAAGVPTVATEILGHWRRRWASWGARASKCSVGFVSGTEFQDVQPSSSLIIPVLFSAYANLKAEFFVQTEKLRETVKPKHRPYVEEALDSLLRRYSSFVAQSAKEQMKQLFGAN